MTISHCPNRTSSLDIWLSYIESLYDKEIELNLNRVQYIALKLKLLKPASFIFTVAGTNGKGTTCRMLEILLIEAGYRVGVYSSPHLLKYTERVRIQGIELNESLHSDSFAFIEDGRDDILLTYFEFGTLSALNLFCKAHLDIVILEVGLGGRLDATNIIDPDISIITNIALDHISWLGPDRNSIGREKAGIFRYNKAAIVGEDDAPSTIADVAKEIGAWLHQLNYDWRWKQTEDKWMFQDQHGTLYSLPIPQIPLSNAATALAALRISGLKINESIIRQQLPLITLSGRFQTISMSPRVILDVAHNPHAAYYLATRLAKEVKKGQIHAVIGMLLDKDIKGTLVALESQVDYWYYASLTCPRGALAEELMSFNISNNSRTFNNVKAAWEAAYSYATQDDTIIVCGSFYTVSQVIMLVNYNK
ncbi:bifunctional tetrahydrofolate synthase/dihydrofolate synthase [Pantoea sp. Mhis]|uniref:bifunctional tetrahydrofolate synthase/dihydrofolate synthase n=1 Tax=Pantoea sp. Mhis TaxID=2576759 RepID=UPI00135B27FB|nr:bifunctional tetrahydrofolate synthase/dihydrofolate synthase [Pantoea sp. Mhis]MXP56087.1 bifunctional tetrahydrofolate synthase/dihydrofolate synthase [Pantoea sp. Mhis]